MVKYFADVSSFQRDDLSLFQSFVNSGVSSVLIKTTQGSADGSNYLNEKSLTQTRNALKAGMNVGFYHYFLAISNSDAINEAKFFESSVVNLGFGKDTPLCVDVEDNSLKKNQVASYVDSFINYLTAQGYTNVFQYSMASWFWNGYLNANKYPTWVANYGVNSPGVSGNVVGWQYSYTWGGGNQDMSYDYGIFDKKPSTPAVVPTAPVEPSKPKVEDVIKLTADVHGVDRLGIERPEVYKAGSVWKSINIENINGKPYYQISSNIYVPMSATEFNKVVIVKYEEDQPAPLFDGKGNRTSNPDVTIGKGYATDGIKLINGNLMAKIATDQYLPLEYTSGSSFK